MSHKYDTAAQVKIKVSAIVSTYNSELFIEGCLNDLIQQTLFVKGELEIVVIDSGSEQNEAAVVMQMQQEYPGRIIYARTERETLYAAWNRGIIASTGTYITNANTDDRHRSDALELLCNLLDEHADIDLVYGDCYVSPIPNETYEQNSRQKLFRYPDYFPPAALLHYQFGPQSMWRKSVHEKIGLFDGSFHAAGDYDFNIRFALKCKALHIPDTLGLYLETPSAISFRDDRMASENQIISERYCNSDTIFALYKSAGVPCETDEEKSHVLLDMGVRAIEYYPPWNMGKVEQNLNLAQTCFMKAYQLTPTWPPAHNNLAVTLFHAGKLDKAFKLLEQHVSTSSHTVIQNNVQKIREYKGGIVEFDIFGSDLELPSQKDLSNKQIAASDVNNFCTHNSQDNNFNVQTQRTVGTVLLVIHGFPPHEIAGTQLYVHSVAKQLHRLGNTVRVLFPKYTGEDPVGYIREYEEEGILISTISVPPISEPLDYRQLYEKFNNEQVALSYKKFISRIKPDVVHFHHFIGLSASIIKSTRECNIPIVITLHDGWFFCDQYHFIRPDGTFCDDGPISDTHCAACFSKRNPSITSDIDLIKLLGDRKKYLLSQLSFANTIIVPSRFLLNKLAKHGLAHPHIIVNHLGLPPVISSCNRSMDTGKIRFAYVGHVMPVKGLDILIQAVNRIHSDQAQVDIYGHIIDEIYFNESIKELTSTIPVKFHGMYVPADLPAILCQVDVAVIPSRTESFCFTARECLQAGIPVIASNAGALPEVVHDGVNGFLFETGNYVELANKMDSILRHPEKLKALRAAIKPVKLIEQEVLELVHIYSEVLSEESHIDESELSCRCQNNGKETLRLIAFHLPQFHAIPENDDWWGKDFTEWTNVGKTVPDFIGHYQPHVPTDLGYYDLSDPSVMKAQAALAQEYGIHGFCFYHYWFNGKLLLETPLHHMLKSGEPDFPFCLCWANENWTRAWDGQSGEILIGQNYTDADDVRHMYYLSSFFEDPRYIRIDDKPLLLVYRANQIPDPLRTTTTWREVARKLGLGEIYLCRVESFFDEHTDPAGLGFDAAIEFQPDWVELGNVQRLDIPDAGDNSCYDYADVVREMIGKKAPDYNRFPCVFPSWDNSPRRKTNAVVIHDASPHIYKNWLKESIKKVKNNPAERRIVFINAWNEWGEGNHLEPDAKHGRGYLEATQKAVNEVIQEIYRFTVSIIIPVHNELGVLPRFLEAIIRTISDVSFEIIVVDNGSTDGTAHYLDTLAGSPVSVIRNAADMGFDYACKQAVDSAHGEHLVFLKCNPKVPRGWLNYLVGLMVEDYSLTAISANLWIGSDATNCSCDCLVVRHDVCNQIRTEIDLTAVCDDVVKSGLSHLVQMLGYKSRHFPSYKNVVYRFNDDVYEQFDGNGWIGPDVIITVPYFLLKMPLVVTFDLFAPKVSVLDDKMLVVKIYVDDDQVQTYVYTRDNEGSAVQLQIPAASRDVAIKIQSDAYFIPELLGESDDFRKLSLLMQNLHYHLYEC